MYHFDWDAVLHALPALGSGLEITLILTVIVIAISTIAGFPLALARMSRNPIISWPAQFYIEAFRGTPMLIQLLWVFFALPALLGLTIPSYMSVVLALSGNLTAFLAEAYRAGLQSVPVEQIECAQMLRLSRWTTRLHIIFPQAFKQQIPTILSLDIQLFKDTSLVSALGIGELTFQANVVASATYRPIEVYTTAAIIYFAIAFPAAIITSIVERRMLDRSISGAMSRGPMSRFLRMLMPGQRPV